MNRQLSQVVKIRQLVNHLTSNLLVLTPARRVMSPRPFSAFASSPVVLTDFREMCRKVGLLAKILIRVWCVRDNAANYNVGNSSVERGSATISHISVCLEKKKVFIMPCIWLKKERCLEAISAEILTVLWKGDAKLPDIYRQTRQFVRSFLE